MGNEINVEPLKMSNEAKYELRKQIVRLKKQGKSTNETEELTGAKKRHIQSTWKKYLEGGIAGIKAHKTGRPKGSNRKLTKAQELEIQKIIIDKHPEQLKLKGFLWDRKGIRDLIWQKYKIKIPLSTLGSYLARWGFSAQRPTIHSNKQNPEKVKKWLFEDYPAIKKQAKAEKGDIFWGDETGIQNETNYVKGYAPVGKTPVLPANPDKKVRLNMISAITNQGKLRFMFYQESMNQNKMKQFIIRLIKGNNGRKIFFILDHLKSHHGKMLHEWLSLHKDKVQVFFLPPYAPEYNPDEYFNGNVKREMAKLPAVKNTKEIKSCVRKIVKKIQCRTSHVASFFRNKWVRYAA
jgi:transposase